MMDCVIYIIDCVCVCVRVRVRVCVCYSNDQNIYEAISYNLRTVQWRRKVSCTHFS